jgi:hypothetical protein
VSLAQDFKHLDLVQKTVAPGFRERLARPDYRAKFIDHLIDTLNLDGDFANRFDNAFMRTGTIHAVGPGAAHLSKGIVRRVRTFAGVKRFKQPLRSIIRPDNGLNFEADLAAHLRVHQRQANEELFVWHSRVLRSLPDTMDVAEVLARIRERYDPDEHCFVGARQYRQKLGLPEPKIDWDKVKVDPAKSKAVAEAYAAMQSNPDDPYVKQCYDDFRRQNEEMFQFITNELGIDIIFQRFEPGMEPYESAEAQAHDVKTHKRMVIDTRLGEGHPIMPADEYARFRAVHDIFGHVAVGSGFDRHGEYAAWLSHMSMYTGLGAKAMSTEYHGTNSVIVHTGVPAVWKAVILPDHLIPDIYDDLGNQIGKAEPVPDTLTCPDLPFRQWISKRAVPCGVCGKPMTDPVSIRLGMGPSHLKQKAPGVKAKVDRILRAKGLTRQAAVRMGAGHENADSHRFAAQPRNTALKVPAKAKGGVKDISRQVPFEDDQPKDPFKDKKNPEVKASEGDVLEVRGQDGALHEVLVTKVGKQGFYHGVVLDGERRGDKVLVGPSVITRVLDKDQMKDEYLDPDRYDKYDEKERRWMTRPGRKDDDLNADQADAKQAADDKQALEDMMNEMPKGATVIFEGGAGIVDRWENKDGLHRIVLEDGRRIRPKDVVDVVIPKKKGPLDPITSGERKIGDRGRGAVPRPKQIVPKMGDYVGVRHVGVDKRGKVVRVGRLNVDVEVPIHGGKQQKVVRNVKIADLKEDPKAVHLKPMGGAKEKKPRAFLPGGQGQPRQTPKPMGIETDIDRYVRDNMEAEYRPFLKYLIDQGDDDAIYPDEMFRGFKGAWSPGIEELIRKKARIYLEGGRGNSAQRRAEDLQIKNVDSGPKKPALDRKINTVNSQGRVEPRAHRKLREQARAAAVAARTSEDRDPLQAGQALDGDQFFGDAHDLVMGGIAAVLGENVPRRKIWRDAIKVMAMRDIGKDKEADALVKGIDKYADGAGISPKSVDELFEQAMKWYDEAGRRSKIEAGVKAQWAKKPKKVAPKKDPIDRDRDKAKEILGIGGRPRVKTKPPRPKLNVKEKPKAAKPQVKPDTDKAAIREEAERKFPGNKAEQDIFVRAVEGLRLYRDGKPDEANDILSSLERLAEAAGIDEDRANRIIERADRWQPRHDANRARAAAQRKARERGVAQRREQGLGHGVIPHDEAVQKLKDGVSPLDIDTDDLRQAMEDSGRFQFVRHGAAGISPNEWAIDLQEKGPTIDLPGYKKTNQRVYMVKASAGGIKNDMINEVITGLVSEQVRDKGKKGWKKGQLRHPKVRFARQPGLAGNDGAIIIMDHVANMYDDNEGFKRVAGGVKVQDEDVGRGKHKDSMVHLALWDFIINNGFDRHQNNQFFAEIGGGWTAVIIDNGFGLGADGPPSYDVRRFMGQARPAGVARRAWEMIGRDRAGLRKAVKDFIDAYDAFDPEELIEQLRAQDLDMQQLDYAREFAELVRRRIDDLKADPGGAAKAIGGI